MIHSDWPMWSNLANDDRVGKNFFVFVALVVETVAVAVIFAGYDQPST